MSTYSDSRSHLYTSTQSSWSCRRSGRDDGRSTASTEYSDRAPGKRKGLAPVIVDARSGYTTAYPQHYGRTRWVDDCRSSWSTYASTLQSEDEDEDTQPPVEHLPERHPFSPIYAIPSEPPQFADHFPSTRRLHIRHDDATLDGNMNLRIDTSKRGSFGREDITLFHLRMIHLQNRQFSLRRYFRFSGREVCHSKVKLAGAGRSGIRQALNHALTTLGIRSGRESNASLPLKRHDSGYHSVEQTRRDAARPQSDPKSPNITLEFSNYSHVDIRRTGFGHLQHYNFEYWGGIYSWKRHIRRSGTDRTVSFHLYKATSSRPIAHIVPNILTPRESHEEKLAGGWVPPCSLWISDRSLLDTQTDLSE